MTEAELEVHKRGEKGERTSTGILDLLTYRGERWEGERERESKRERERHTHRESG